MLLGCLKRGKWQIGKGQNCSLSIACCHLRQSPVFVVIRKSAGGDKRPYINENLYQKDLSTKALLPKTVLCLS